MGSHIYLNIYVYSMDQVQNRFEYLVMYSLEELLKLTDVLITPWL